MQECTCFHDSDGCQGIYNKLDHNHPFLDLIYTLLWTCVTKEPVSNWARISQEPSVATSSAIGLQTANPPTALRCSHAAED